jgi:hypothetical protein
LSIILFSMQMAMIAYNAALNEIGTGFWASIFYLAIVAVDLCLGN